MAPLQIKPLDSHRALHASHAAHLFPMRNCKGLRRATLTQAIAVKEKQRRNAAAALLQGLSCWKLKAASGIFVSRARCKPIDQAQSSHFILRTEKMP